MESTYWRRLNSRKVSRRSVLQQTSLITAAGGALALVGCGDDTSSSPASNGTRPANSTPTPAVAAAQIKAGGQMKIVWETEPQGTLDPHQTAGGFSRPMQAAIYEGLIYKPAGKPEVGMLASSWEQADQTVFTFRLGKGIKFHDGTELTADIAKWNIERTLGKGYINDGGYKGAAKGLTKIEAIDATTLKCTFDAKKVDSLQAFDWLGQNSFGMVSRTAAEKLGDAIGKQPVGTGPFTLKEWASGTRMTLEKFPGYWGKDENGRPLPYLDSLQFVDIPDLNVAVVSLQNNEIQSVMLGPQEAQPLTNDKNVELIRKLVPDLFIYLNHNKAPFNDLRLRKALSAAIKREDVMKAAFFGQAQAFGGGYHPDGDWYDANFKGQVYDPAIVKQNLQAAGMPDGFSFEMAVLPRGPRKSAAELMQAQLKEFGIKMNILQMESNDYTVKGLRNGELQSLFAGGGTTELGETPTTIYSLIGPGYGINPPADKAQVGLDLFAKTQTQFDKKERYKTFQDLAQWFWLDFVGRVDVGREVKIAAQRQEFGGFDWYSTTPQGTWVKSYKRG